MSDQPSSTTVSTQDRKLPKTVLVRDLPEDVAEYLTDRKKAYKFSVGAQVLEIVVTEVRKRIASEKVS